MQKEPISQYPSQMGLIKVNAEGLLHVKLVVEKIYPLVFFVIKIKPR